MPAGLDGNPDPLSTPERSEVIASVVASVGAAKAPGQPLLVAIDGIDGSGKTTFADEVAGAARKRRLHVVRATVDSFHNERRVRHARGSTSPLGFYADSHNLAALRRELLDPFKAGDGSEYRVAMFDEPSDTPLDTPYVRVDSDDVLIFDGIFLQRPELVSYWDLIVFLDAQQRIDLNRLGHILEDLPNDPVEAVAHTLTWAERIERYSSGMRIYIDSADPIASAHVVIDNNKIGSPVIVKGG